MNDEFQAVINKHRARMRELGDVFQRTGSLRAISQRDPSYSILLSRYTTSDAPWRVTSFRDKEPTGHREYDHLEGAGPTQAAFAEFASDDFKLVIKPLTQRQRDRRTKEAEEATEACAQAIANTPDDAGKAIFERSQRIWQRRLSALQP